MNRYTQLTASEYKPVDLQTMMIAPMMMRQRHDQMTAQQEKLRSDMAASSAVMSQYDEQWKTLESEYNKQLDIEANNLSRHGYTKNSAKNMAQLSAMYGNAMKVKAEMDNSKATYLKNYQDYLEAGYKDNHSFEDLNRNWNVHASDYTGYNTDGSIKSIGQYGAAKNVNLEDALNRIHKFKQDTKTTIGKAGGPSVVKNADGSLSVYNGSGTREQVQNVQSLLTLANLEASKYDDPNSMEFKSAVFKGQDPAIIKQEIYMSAFGMMHNDITDDIRQSLSVVGYKNPNDKEDDLSSAQTYLSSINENNDGVFKNIKTTDDVNERLDQLLRKGDNLSGAEINELNRLQVAKNEVENALANDPVYQKLKSTEDSKIISKIRSTYRIADGEQPKIAILKPGEKLPKGTTIGGSNNILTDIKASWKPGHVSVNQTRYYVVDKHGRYTPIVKDEYNAITGKGVSTKLHGNDVKNYQKEMYNQFNTKDTTEFFATAPQTSTQQKQMEIRDNAFVTSVDNVDKLNKSGNIVVSKINSLGKDQDVTDYMTDDNGASYNQLLSAMKGHVTSEYSTKNKYGEQKIRLNYSFDTGSKAALKYGSTGSITYTVRGTMEKNGYIDQQNGANTYLKSAGRGTGTTHGFITNGETTYKDLSGTVDYNTKDINAKASAVNNFNNHSMSELMSVNPQNVIDTQEGQDAMTNFIVSLKNAAPANKEIKRVYANMVDQQYDSYELYKEIEKILNNKSLNSNGNISNIAKTRVGLLISK